MFYITELFFFHKPKIIELSWKYGILISNVPTTSDVTTVPKISSSNCPSPVSSSIQDVLLSLGQTLRGDSRHKDKHF